MSDGVARVPTGFDDAHAARLAQRAARMRSSARQLRVSAAGRSSANAAALLRHAARLDERARWLVHGPPLAAAS